MTASRPWTVRSLTTVDSTQAEAARRIAAGETLHRVAFRASRQQAGVGRFGRGYDSPEGGSWQTMALHDQDGALLDGRLTPALAALLADGLTELLARHRSTTEDAARDAASDAAPGAVRLKWPNDLWWTPPHGPNGKLGGILVERRARHLLIGVGLNAVNDPPPGGARLGVPVHVACDAVLDAVDSLLDRGVPDDLPAAWAGRHLLDGRHVTVRTSTRPGAAPCEGRVLGLAPDGGLRLVLPDGSERVVRSGTVTAVDPPLRTPEPAPPSAASIATGTATAPRSDVRPTEPDRDAC
ncbi:MAG: hypothetical protein WD336_02225 [Trueperaceae bacterium]